MTRVKRFMHAIQHSNYSSAYGVTLSLCAEW